MAKPVVVRLQANADDLNKTIGGMLSGLKEKLLGINPIVAGTVGAIAGIGVAAFKIGEEFDAAYDKIQIGTGATGAELEGLQESFKKAFAQVPVDMGEVSTVIADLNTNLGLTGAPLEKLAVQFIDLERLGLGFSGNVQTITRVFGDWSIATEDQAGAMNFLAAAAQSTGVGVDKLATQVVQFGAPMRELGFEFEEAAVLIGKFEKEGVNTESVLAGLKLSLAKFGEAGLTGKEGLQLTIDAIKNAGSEAEASKIAMETFGTRAGVDLKTAIQEGRFEIGDLTKDLKESGVSITALAWSTDDWRERLKILGNTFTVALEPASKALFELATDSIPIVVEGFQHLTLGIAAIADGFFQLTGKGGGLAAAMAKTSNSLKDFKVKMLDIAEEAKKLADAKKGLPAVAGGAKDVGEQTDKAHKPVLTFEETMGKLRGTAEGTKKELERFDLAKAIQATEDLKRKADALRPALSSLEFAVPPVTVNLDAMAEAANSTLIELGNLANNIHTVTAPAMTRAELDSLNLRDAFEALGIKSQALKDEELAALKTAVNEVEAAMVKGDATTDDLAAAQAAYAKAAGKPGGVIDSTKGFKTALDDLFGSLGSLKTDLVGFSADKGFTFGFGAALDDLKGKAAALANEGIKLVIGKLTELIGLGPSLGSFGGIFKDALGFGSAATSAGGTAAGGVGGAGGAGGAAASGGIAATVGVITGVVSAISGVVGNFQMAGMNNKLDGIRANTLTTSLATFHTADVVGPGMWGVLNEHLPSLSHIAAGDGALWQSHARLAEIRDSVGSNGTLARDIASAVKTALAGVRVEMDGREVGRLVGDHLAAEGAFS